LAKDLRRIVHRHGQAIHDPSSFFHLLQHAVEIDRHLPPSFEHSLYLQATLVVKLCLQPLVFGRTEGQSQLRPLTGQLDWIEQIARQAIG
jgi:hypothetical protein